MSVRDGDVQCTLCAHLCRIRDGETGLCRVRANESGEPALPYYAHVSALHVDPVEKKPLYHVHPGSRLLSVGFLGCNFRCPFCQNYSISQSTRARSEVVLPSELPDLAIREGALGIAYTYNEPTIHYEYLMEAASLAQQAGLGNVVVTNGHLTRRPARELLQRMDAANVDLKSFDPGFYEQELGGKLEAVKEFIAIASEETALEVTTLLIPGKNDSDEEIRAMSAFLAGLDPHIPYHISGYYPTYHYEVPPTSVGSVERACELAREYLYHVYPGNVPGDDTTRCSSCGADLIERHGYGVRLVGLDAGRTRCSSCGHEAPFTWFDA